MHRRPLAPLLVSLIAPAVLAQGYVNELCSADSAGAQGPESSGVPSLSTDGRLIAFQSDAALVAGDTNGVGDVFLRDRIAGTTVRVSETATGVEGDGPSLEPWLSADGTLCVFTSEATNLVPGDTNGVADVFLKDLVNGALTRLSVSTGGAQGDNFSFQPAISADGGTVVFVSLASNLDGADLNPSWDVFRHVLATGTTTLVSRSSAGIQANGKCADPAVSARGDRVAYGSSASNLVANDTNVAWDVFVFDVATGVTTRVSTDAAGNQATGGCFDPVFARDGELVIFEGEAINLVPETILWFSDVFVKELATGAIEMVTVNDLGEQGDLSSGSPYASQDGRYIAYRSRAENLVPGDGNGPGGWDIFVFDRVTQTVERLSVDPAGLDPNDTSSAPVISADGSVVAYESLASNLIGADANGNVQDVFAAVRPSLPWTDLGQGLAGALGAPTLDCIGALAPLGATTFDVAGAAGNAPAGYVFGTAPANLPLLGGVLVPAPTVVVPIVTDATGTASLTVPWSLETPSGFAVFAQAWVLDPSGPQGFSASNARSDAAF